MPDVKCVAADIGDDGGNDDGLAGGRSIIIF